MPTETFNSAGSHTYTVPGGVTTVTLRVWGAGGGDGAAAGTSTATGAGQPGAFAEGTLSVSPGDTLYLTVGSAGADATPTSAGAGGSGDGSGGSGGQNSSNGVDASGGGGGGATAVRYPTDTQADRVLVAPGGGGGGAAAGPSGVETSTIAAGAGGEATGDGLGPGGAGGPDGATGATTQIDGASAGGGGGAGAPGGVGGSASAGSGFGDAPPSETGGGGAGGATLTSGVSGATTTPAGGNSGTGQVTVQTKPLAPSTPSVALAAVGDAIDLTWQDNSTNATEIRVYRAQSPGTTPADYSRVATLPAGATSHTDSFDFADGRRYHYRVGAANSVGVSLSNEATLTTPLPAPTNLSVDAVGATTADLSWVTNHDTGSVTVQVKPTSASSWTDAATGLSLSTASYQVTGLRTGEQYDVRVAAVTDDTLSLDATNFDVAPGQTATFSKPLTVEDSQYQKPLDNAGTVQPDDQQ